MSDWPTVMATLDGAWPGELTDRDRAAYATVLEDEDPAEVLAAIKRLAKQGGDFRPSASRIGGEIRTDPSRPTFDEALAQLVRAIQVRPDSEVLVRGAEWMHPYAHAFLRSFGVDRFRRLEIYDDEYGDLRMRELRDAWLRFEQVAETRERHGLELAPGRNGQLRELGAPVRRLLDGMVPDGEPQPTTTTEGPTE